MQTLYVMEYHCGAYDRASYDRITWDTGKTAWNWGGKNWDWATRHPPKRVAKLEGAERE
jgi:hypothetical protein